MISIYEANYKKKEKQELIYIDSVNPANYIDKYRGNLYCATANCSAKLAYVHKENDSDHFRTWRGSPHIETCLFYFEKVATREGKRTEGQVTGIVSDERIKNSLREAFLLEMMSKEQKKRQRERDKERRKRKREREKIRGGTKKEAAQRIVSNPDEINENLISGGMRLYKKSADALKEKDLGETRTVTGQLKRVLINSSKSIVIEVEKNNVQVNIKFEEAFFAANKSYVGMFHHIERYLNEHRNLVFSATGEVRFSKISNRYEIVVFNSVGFLIHNKTLNRIVVEHSLIDENKEAN
ncbi:hypothetical protein [Priestia taiwanensis]|uniref:Uncharacterized protein n=1 Tax=Priestia taiwanensis TaxID=1347902 RepID=A0A917ER85_9BACI|nr:hypothetical protein [Priestia taiwanensis]MBM7363559.1 hypothetical protein [Priestia taiwanensis]GGE76093.1 hypothetical protein GCM10007140_27320 [Priestia taiwanensis]